MIIYIHMYIYMCVFISDCINRIVDYDMLII